MTTATGKLPHSAKPHKQTSFLTRPIEGSVEIHSEFYDVITLKPGETVHVDSTMGHADLLGQGCNEALIIGASASASADEDQMDTLFEVHGDEGKPH